jgi:hypothetical protein
MAPNLHPQLSDRWHLTSAHLHCIDFLCQRSCIVSLCFIKALIPIRRKESRMGEALRAHIPFLLLCSWGCLTNIHQVSTVHYFEPSDKELPQNIYWALFDDLSTKCPAGEGSSRSLPFHLSSIRSLWNVKRSILISYLDIRDKWPVQKVHWSALLLSISGFFLNQLDVRCANAMCHLRGGM